MNKVDYPKYHQEGETTLNLDTWSNAHTEILLSSNPSIQGQGRRLATSSMSVWTITGVYPLSKESSPNTQTENNVANEPTGDKQHYHNLRLHI